MTETEGLGYSRLENVRKMRRRGDEDPVARPEERRKSLEQLQGIVENVIYQSDDKAFVVFRVRPEQGRSQAVAGRIPAPFVGEKVLLEGEWVEHPRFGQQFQARTCRRMPFSSLTGIQRFLASGSIRGIGTVTAKRLVDHFGHRTLEVLEHYPHRLTEVEGIGRRKAKIIRDGYGELAEMKEILLFLESHGVSGTLAPKIITAYGNRTEALRILKQAPYRLAGDVEGIGFRTADQLARSAGMEHNALERIEAGVEYALVQLQQNGHCCLPEEKLAEEAARLLGVERLEGMEAIGSLLRKDVLVMEEEAGQRLIYTEHLYRTECTVAERLERLQQQVHELPAFDWEVWLEEWEKNQGTGLAAAQRQAVQAAFHHGVMVLTGGPGTGKTTAVRSILALWERLRLATLLTAPTGRAAKRLSETTGREAVTVHRLLEAGGSGFFGKDEDNCLEGDGIIVDEASMMDMVLMAQLLRAAPDGCRLILVGDVDQLPAVGPGSVLKDIIRSQTVPVVRLTEVFRQAEESVIIRNAHRIHRGQVPECNESCEFVFEEVKEEELAARRVVEICRDELPSAGFDVWTDVQVLSPMHRMPCGVENLNRMLQAALNLPQPGEDELTGERHVFRQGDKVMQVRNNYEKNVCNGDVGRVLRLEETGLVVRYSDQDVTYQRKELEELQLAYAMSVHKSQGSEYPVVLIPLVNSHQVMMQRSLLYTGITRAKERVILLGHREALRRAVSNDRTGRRYSLLAQRLRHWENGY